MAPAKATEADLAEDTELMFSHMRSVSSEAKEVLVERRPVKNQGNSAMDNNRMLIRQDKPTKTAVESG